MRRMCFHVSAEDFNIKCMSALAVVCFVKSIMHKAGLINMKQLSS